MTSLLVDDLLARFTGSLRRTGDATLCTAGGLSGAEVRRVPTASGVFALRAWPTQIVTAERPEWIAGVLRRAASAGCRKVPVPLALADDPRRTCVPADDRWWQLEPWLPGEADFLAKPSEAKLQAAFRELGLLHIALGEGSPRELRLGTSPAIAKRQAVFDELTHGGRHEVQRAIVANASEMRDWQELQQDADEYSQHFAKCGPRVESLLQLAARQEFALQPVAGDLHAEHVLFEGDEVAGFVDFGAMAVDSVALDLARLVGSMAGEDTKRRAAALAAYAAARQSNAGLSVEAEVLVEVLDRSGVLLAPYRWLRWIYLERREFPRRDAVLARWRTIMERLRKMAETW
ncbi:MAG: hypothetical protein C0483_09360 [Pirellula sp.]|nr:hypothetical protein [Pirellula sp.]